MRADYAYICIVACIFFLFRTDYLCGMARHEHGFNAFHRAGSQCQIGHLDAARAVKCDKGGGLRINLKKGEKKPGNVTNAILYFSNTFSSIVKRVVLFEESGNAATEFNPALDTADTSTITPPGLKSPIGNRYAYGRSSILYILLKRTFIPVQIRRPPPVLLVGGQPAKV